MRKFLLVLMLVTFSLALIAGKPTKTRPFGDVDNHPYSTTAADDTLVIDTIFVDNTHYSDCILSVWGYEINGDAMANDSLAVYVTPFVYSPNRNPDSTTLMLNEDTLDFVTSCQASQGFRDTISLAGYLPECQAFIVILMTLVDPGTDTFYVYPYYTLVERM